MPLKAQFCGCKRKSQLFAAESTVLWLQTFVDTNSMFAAESSFVAANICRCKEHVCKYSLAAASVRGNKEHVCNCKYSLVAANVCGYK